MEVLAKVGLLGCGISFSPRAATTRRELAREAQTRPVSGRSCARMHTAQRHRARILGRLGALNVLAGLVGAAGDAVTHLGGRAPSQARVQVKECASAAPARQPLELGTSDSSVANTVTITVGTRAAIPVGNAPPERTVH